MSDKGDKGMIGDLTDFYKASKNFIINHFHFNLNFIFPM